MFTSAKPTSSALGLLVVALFLATGAGAAPYKWVDKDGNVHYSDKPPPGAKLEPVELKPLTEVESQPVPQSDSSSAPAPAPAADAAAASGNYNELRITSPVDQSTLRDPSASVAIGVTVDPPLSNGDVLEFTLDGKVVESPIESLDRGTHHIGARVLSANGGERIAARTITIYVHQTVVKEVTPPKPKPKKP